MKLCTICGMGKNANKAHGSDYSGVGKHDMKLATAKASSKSLGDDDIIVNFGGELKSVGETGFEGYLVRFSSADDPDLVGDFFTKSTEFFVEDGAVIPILYDHGLNATMKKTKIGRATVSYDDAGLFIKGELETRENYEAFVKEINSKLVKAKKAGLSSGAASHMVERKQVKKGVNEILSWGIAEGSITPAPTEPKCEVSSLKSYFNSREDPFEVKSESGEGMDPLAGTKPHKFAGSQNDPTECSVCGEEFAEALHTKAVGEEDPTKVAADKKKKTAGDGKMKAVDAEEPEEALANQIQFSIKGLYESKLAEKTPSVWETRQVLDEVYRDIATAASISDITGVTIDVEAKVKEAKLEEAAREIPLVVKQIDDWVTNGGTSTDGCGSRYFYLRSLPNTLFNEDESIKGGLGDGLNLDEHSDRVVHAVEEYANLGATLDKAVKALIERCEKKIEYRANDPLKSGRTISKATLEKLAAIQAANKTNGTNVEELDKSLNELVALAQPKKSADVAATLALEYQYAQTQTALALSGSSIS